MSRSRGMNQVRGGVRDETVGQEVMLVMDSFEGGEG